MTTTLAERRSMWRCSQICTQKEEDQNATYVLVRSIGAKWVFAVVPASNEHVIDLMIKCQCQSVRTAVTVRLSSTHHERTVLNTHIIIIIIVISMSSWQQYKTMRVNTLCKLLLKLHDRITLLFIIQMALPEKNIHIFLSFLLVMLDFRFTVNTVWPMSVSEFMRESLYFVVRVGCRRKTIHVRYLISWWASCNYWLRNNYWLRVVFQITKHIPST